MVRPTSDVAQRLFEVPCSVAVPLTRIRDSAQLRTCLIDALIAPILKEGGLIGLTPEVDLIEGAKVVKKELLVRMMTTRNKTRVREVILLARLWTIIGRISDNCYRSTKLPQTRT